MNLYLENAGVSQGKEVILEGITYDFEPGRIYVLMGRTSAGKTSLMRTIAGLIELTQGKMLFDGKDFDALPTWQRNTSMVYQQFINYPNLTVLENVTFPLRRSGMSRALAEETAHKLIDKVGLGDFLDRLPGKLSGGQQQRVAIARALIRNANVLLLDEPLMNLDYKLREQLREEFRDLLTTARNSVTIYATTEPSEALLIGDELIIMHEGKVIQHGKPSAVFEHPNSVTVAKIVNDPPMSILPAKISDGMLCIGDLLRLRIPMHLVGIPDGVYQAGFRASELTISTDGEVTEQGVVDLVEVAGSETLIYVNTPTGEIVIQKEGIHGYHVGEKLGVSIPSARTFLFNPSGELVVAPGN